MCLRDRDSDAHLVELRSLTQAYSLPPSFLYPISVSLVPAISGALGQGDRQTARRHTRTALRMALLLALPSGVDVYKRQPARRT